MSRIPLPGRYTIASYPSVRSTGIRKVSANTPSTYKSNPVVPKRAIWGKRIMEGMVQLMAT